MRISEANSRSALIAEKIVSGDLDPYDGAMMIWKQIVEHLHGPTPDDLWVFKSCASAIEDYLWNAENGGADHESQIYHEKEEIVRAAVTLIASMRQNHGSGI